MRHGFLVRAMLVIAVASLPVGYIRLTAPGIGSTDAEHKAPTVERVQQPGLFQVRMAHPGLPDAYRE